MRVYVCVCVSVCEPYIAKGRWEVKDTNTDRGDVIVFPVGLRGARVSLHTPPLPDAQLDTVLVAARVWRVMAETVI